MSTTNRMKIDLPENNNWSYNNLGSFFMPLNLTYFDLYE